MSCVPSANIRSEEVHKQSTDDSETMHMPVKSDYLHCNAYTIVL
uniref:Uncharacterized protein n=1 Tax=Rhizophora mucronata TaxID=61149 RepID=A0A2P2QKH0_RHIMU